MAFFSDGEKSVLAMNNECVNLGIMFANRESGKPETADDMRKCKAGHGVSVVEIAQKDGVWGIVQDSPYNRRITPDTPMEITGPARGHDMMKTAADPDGMTALGTWNNCGNGRTPWAPISLARRTSTATSRRAIPISRCPQASSAMASRRRIAATAGR